MKPVFPIAPKRPTQRGVACCTPEEVAAIKHEYWHTKNPAGKPWSHPQLADKYGLSSGVVGKICGGVYTFGSIYNNASKRRAQEEAKRAVALWNELRDVSLVAERMSRPVDSVRKYLRRNGIELTVRPTEAEVRRVHERYVNEPLTSTQAAVVLGVCGCTAIRLFRRYGLRVRTWREAMEPLYEQRRKTYRKPEVHAHVP